MSSVFTWKNPPERLNLPATEIHTWRASLDLASPGIQALVPILSEDERVRAERFRSRRDGQRSIASRGILRFLLGRYLATDPGQIKFCYGREGKPFLANESAAGGLRFNVSHSQGLALFAFARGRELGVDLERIEPSVHERIPERFFSARVCCTPQVAARTAAGGVLRLLDA